MDKTTKQEQIEHLKSEIKSDTIVREQLYIDIKQMEKQRSQLWDRIYNNRQKLKKLAGLDGIL